MAHAPEPALPAIIPSRDFVFPHNGVVITFRAGVRTPVESDLMALLEAAEVQPFTKA